MLSEHIYYINIKKTKTKNVQKNTNYNQNVSNHEKKLKKCTSISHFQ